MRILESTLALQRQARAWQEQGLRIGLVPTMGCLHQGHLSLIKLAKASCDKLICSIYVNPSQFAAHEDLDRYPQPFDDDLEHCRKAGVDVLFHPQTLYPEQAQISIEAADMASCLCGQQRPEHFSGVLTVVQKLFHLSYANLAVFGEKDYQQFCLIRRMTEELFMPIELLAAPIKRETDGLALSSRNRYLSDAQRQQAVGLFKTLQAVQQAVRHGERHCQRLCAIGKHSLQAYQLQSEYVSIRRDKDLASIERLTEQQPARLFLAAKLGNTRLIDNLALEL